MNTPLTPLKRGICLRYNYLDYFTLMAFLWILKENFFGIEAA